MVLTGTATIPGLEKQNVSHGPVGSARVLEWYALMSLIHETIEPQFKKSIHITLKTLSLQQLREGTDTTEYVLAELNRDCNQRIEFRYSKGYLFKLIVGNGTQIEIPKYRPSGSYSTPAFKMLEFMGLIGPANGQRMNGLEQLEWIKAASRNGFKQL